MLTWTYIVLDIYGKQNFKRLTIHEYLPTREQTLTNLKFQK